MGLHHSCRDGSQLHWSEGSRAEFEENVEDEGEPDVDAEPSLGWSDHSNQAFIATEHTTDIEGNGSPSGDDDMEPALGWPTPEQDGMPLGWSYDVMSGAGVDNDA